MRPAPISPPMPEHLARADLEAGRMHVGRPADLADVEHDVLGGGGPLGEQLLDPPADHLEDQIRRRPCRQGSPVATVLPSTSTVTRSPIRLISSSRWEM